MQDGCLTLWLSLDAPMFIGSSFCAALVQSLYRLVDTAMFRCSSGLEGWDWEISVASEDG